MTSRPQIDVVALRRRLHRRPELAFLEVMTAATVIELVSPFADDVRYGRAVVDLQQVAGLPDAQRRAEAVVRARQQLPRVDEGVLAELGTGATGVVATVRGSRPGPVTAIRFDMDALPVPESDDPSHRPAAEGFGSEAVGLMHACGHDGHVGIGIALAERLSHRDFAGEVRLIFQPAEEGVRGAAAMIRRGVVADVDVMLGIHLGIGLPTGTIACSVDGLLATEKVTARLTGVASHAALAPERGRSAALGVAAATLALHALAQNASAQTRVNVGVIRAGEATNVVPDSGEIRFELRSDDRQALRELRQRADRVLRGIADAHDLGVRVQTEGSATTVACDGALVSRVASAAARQPGVVVMRSSAMTASDDVSLFMAEVQRRGGLATFVIVGAGSPAPHHTSSFDIDEESLEIALRMLEALVRGE